MAGAIDSDVNACDGSDVLAQLNGVFNNPRSAKEKAAAKQVSLQVTAIA